QSLNSEFDSVRVAAMDDQWIEVARGQVLPAERVAHPLRLRVQARNTDDVAWDSDQGAPGGVRLRICQAGGVRKEIAIERNINWGQTCQFEFSLGSSPRTGPFALRFASERTGEFGETFRFELSEPLR
ncbi:MAG: hypothetical protein M1485_00935, partial [Chloroflexi bacterium]|nr:hypothetical protein [Chloroflexota bacterium]